MASPKLVGPDRDEGVVRVETTRRPTNQLNHHIPGTENPFTTIRTDGNAGLTAISLPLQRNACFTVERLRHSAGVRRQGKCCAGKRLGGVDLIQPLLAEEAHAQPVVVGGLPGSAALNTKNGPKTVLNRVECCGTAILPRADPSKQR